MLMVQQYAVYRPSTSVSTSHVGPICLWATFSSLDWRYLAFKGLIRVPWDIYLRFRGLVAKYERLQNGTVPMAIGAQYSRYRVSAPPRNVDRCFATVESTLEMQIASDRRPRITLTMWDHPQSLRDSPSGPAVKDARPAGATLFARRPARLRLRTEPPAVRPTGKKHRQNTMSAQKALRRGPFAHCGYSGITRSRGIPPNRRQSHPRPERHHRTARSAYQPYQHHRPPVRSRRRPRPRPARVRP